MAFCAQGSAGRLQDHPATVLDGAKDRGSPNSQSTSAKHLLSRQAERGDGLEDGRNADSEAF